MSNISWEEIVDECYNKQLKFINEVVEVIYSSDRSNRAVILQRSDGLLSVVYEVLYPYDDDELNYFGDTDLHGYWSPIGSQNSVFDSIESAKHEIRSLPPFKYGFYAV